MHQLLRNRLHANQLDVRGSLETALPAGLQDSTPRAGQLSLHARVSELGVDGWADPSLVQVWGLRLAAYIVRVDDVAIFTLGRLPRDDATTIEVADRVAAHLGDDEREPSQVEAELGLPEFELRRLSRSGRLLIRWNASTITVRATACDADPEWARIELARRFVQVFGITDATAFATWAGISRADATLSLRGVSRVQATATEFTGTRLLPVDDPYLRLDRPLLVPDADHRASLFARGAVRGAILVDGSIEGWWQRQGSRVTLHPWGKLGDAEAEAWGLPVPGGVTSVVVSSASAVARLPMKSGT